MSIRLPDCMMNAYRVLFPTLDFSRIQFHEGIPGLFDRGQDGITLTSLWSDINIYLQNGRYHPCDTYTFTLIAHELVHALQMQQTSLFGGRLNSWIYTYLNCWLNTFSSDEGHGNALEDEAYQFQHALESCLRDHELKPCQCEGVPFITATPNFNELLQRACPNLSKRNAGEGDCSSNIEHLVPVLGPILALLWNIVTLIVSLIVSIIYTIIDAIVSFFQWLGNLFSPSAGGSLNLLFSTDEGLSFSHKATFERSQEQPALALGATHLFIGWTGADDNHHLNVITAPNQTKKKLSELAKGAGPALTHDGARLYIAWQGTDNRLNVMNSVDGQNFADKTILPERSTQEATPGLASGNGRLYLAWISTDSRLNIISSTDGAATWEGKLTFNESTWNNGTAALAFGDDTLYLAWVGTDRRNLLNIMSLDARAGGGGLILQKKVTLNETSNKKTGLALTFGDGQLFLSWISTNKQINVMSSDSSLTFQNKRSFEKSRGDTGPALAFAPGLLCVSWIGQD